MPDLPTSRPPLAAAVLIELADRDRLEVDEDGRPILAGTGPTGHPVLDDAMRRLAAQDADETIEDALATIVSGMYVRLLHVLTERGYLAKIGERRWRLERRPHRDELCARLREVLIDGAEPDERTGALILLLHHIYVVRDIVVNEQDAIDRAEEIAAGDWATNPVTRALLEADDDWVLIGEDIPGAGIAGTLRDLGDGIADFFTAKGPL